MLNRKVSKVRLFFRNNFRRVETLFFIAKSLLSDRQFIYLSAVLVSISTAFAVIILKGFAHNVLNFANYINGYLKLPYINSLLPIAGILLTVLVVRKILNGRMEKGTSSILYSVARRGGIIPRKQMYSQIITSSLTVGLGGSAGLESPITITGAAFGSNFAQKYKLPQKDRVLMLACGVAAGIAAAFNAPIAGVLFAIEVVLTDVSITAFIPIMISAATGAIISTVVLNEEILLSFKQQHMFDYHNIPYYILLGILGGLVSVYHARKFQKIEGYFARLDKGDYRKALYGALPLAGLIFLFPTLFGEGYESIKTLTTNPADILNNTLLDGFKDNSWVLLAFVGLTMMVKVFAAGLTLSSGGNGGNFAPSLFVGSYLGFVVAKLLHLLGFAKNLPLSSFTIVGMAGILSGLFHAPLTAIFLIGEITGGYNLMVPLMIVSSISFAVSKQFEKHSMDIKHLADKGDVFTGNKDKNILSTLDLLSLINTDIKIIKAEENTSDDIVSLLSSTHHNVFAVTDQKNKLIGVIDFNTIKHIVFSPFKIKYSKLDELMSTPPVIVTIEDSVETIMEKFEEANADYLPILKDGKYYGFIYKAKILEAYRQKLREMVVE